MRVSTKKKDGVNRASYSHAVRISLIFLVLGAGLVPGVLGISYNLDSVTVLAGTYTSGNLASLASIDMDRYIVTEVTTATGFDVRYNFSGIPSDLANLTLDISGFYDGNPAHQANISFFNGDSWDIVAVMPDDPTRTNTLYALDPSLYLVGGTLWVKIDHSPTGSAGHTLEIDLLRISGDPLTVTGTNWFFIVLWVILVGGGYVLTKMPLVVIGSIFGFYLAYTLYSLSPLVTLVVLIANLYTAYNGLENWDG